MLRHRQLVHWQQAICQQTALPAHRWHEGSEQMPGSQWTGGARTEMGSDTGSDKDSGRCKGQQRGAAMTQSQRCAASAQTAKVVGRWQHRREGHERAKQSRGSVHWQRAVYQQAAPPACRQRAGGRQTVGRRRAPSRQTTRAQGGNDRQAAGNDVQVAGNGEKAAGNDEQAAVGRGG